MIIPHLLRPPEDDRWPSPPAGPMAAPARSGRRGSRPAGWTIDVRPLLRLGLALAAGALLMAPAPAQQSLAGWEWDEGATKVELTGVFSPPPPSGYQPVVVQLTNATSEKRSWRLEFSSVVGWNARGGRMRSAFELAAEPGRSTATTLLVPLQAALSASSWVYEGGQHQFFVTLTGSRAGEHVSSDNARRAQSFPAIAISDALAQKSLTQLNDEVGTAAGPGHGHDKVFGSRFLAAQLPENWLGFSGFDHVMLTTDEWLALAPGARTALLQAAQFGLRLHLYRSSDSITLASMGLPGAGTESTTLRHGLGGIELVSWNGDTLEAPATVAAFMGELDRRLVQHVSEAYASSRGWGLLTALGERSFAGWQVVVFLLVFGLLIGPVNVFVLAPAGKRHRLFLTTPLLSLGASLLLIGLILAQDGTGGEGRRFIAVHLPPGEPVAHVTQEQVSRTGVLLGSSFTLPRPSYLGQVVLPESPWTKHTASRSGQPMEVRLEGLQAGGNWFQSRAVQGQFLRSLVPTRGRIELVPGSAPGAAPTIVSSLDVELSSFSYLDPDGGFWKAEGPVTKGRPVTLAPTDAAGWSERLHALTTQSSESLAVRIQAALADRPAFLATAAAAPGFAIETLPSIRWREDRVVFFGNLSAQP